MYDFDADTNESRFSRINEVYEYYRDLCGSEDPILTAEELRDRLHDDGYGFVDGGLNHLMIVPQMWWDNLFAETNWYTIDAT